MSGDAGCAWVFGLFVAGVLGFFYLAIVTNNGAVSRDAAAYRLCIENGGNWDGWWKSCSK